MAKGYPNYEHQCGIISEQNLCKRYWIIGLGLIFVMMGVLVGCSIAPATPSVEMVQTAIAATQAANPTVTSTHTATPTPTNTPTFTPTSTETPEPTNTPRPTRTPKPTNTPRPTPTPYVA